MCSHSRRCRRAWLTRSSSQPMSTLDSRSDSPRPGFDDFDATRRTLREAVQAGFDVVVVTPTASGKTLCFNLPVIDRCLKMRTARAIYFYPTKALANDQFAALRTLLNGVEDAPTVAVFHGDLTKEEREPILASPPNILLATPDILHHQQLPKHIQWREWWGSLHFVVIDEAHYYRGVFGSHIGHVMRRVRRIATRYGADPLFICSTATIGNPVEHVEHLIARQPWLVDRDGSPQAERLVARSGTRCSTTLAAPSRMRIASRRQPASSPHRSSLATAPSNSRSPAAPSNGSRGRRSASSTRLATPSLRAGSSPTELAIPAHDAWRSRVASGVGTSLACWQPWPSNSKSTSGRSMWRSSRAIRAAP